MANDASRCVGNALEADPHLSNSMRHRLLDSRGVPTNILPEGDKYQLIPSDQLPSTRQLSRFLRFRGLAALANWSRLCSSTETRAALPFVNRIPNAQTTT